MAIQAVTTSQSTAFEKAKEGMDRGSRKLNNAAAKIASGDISPNNIVELACAETMYSANAKVIHTEDEMLGTLLDVKR
ncbi:flagellar basal body rod C-terminal domain-containing protein [Pelagicoccus albus]|uniref:Flagellar basal-body/hook protein C-terminal domain-containing protein n=2 Tax=Pelagicoccus albus TaxID=415222 RepID=A0A7X1B8K6_9BACT|nr:hypothetical protein [Pelagicoccus albus]